MNRRAAEPIYIVVGMIVIAISLLAIFGVLGGLKAAIFGTAEKQQCSWDLFLSALVSKVPFAEKEAGACKMQTLTVDKKALDARKKLSFVKKGLKKSQSPGNPAREYFPDETKIDEWALDYLMAEQLKGCWDKVWKGKLNIFARGKVEDQSICVVCSQLVWGRDLPGSILYPKDGMITSLDAWLKTTSIPGQSKFYYDHIAEGQTVPPNPAAFAFYTNTPYAVVYMEVVDSYWTGFTSFWKDHPELDLGLLVAGVVIPRLGAVRLVQQVALVPRVAAGVKLATAGARVVGLVGAGSVFYDQAAALYGGNIFALNALKAMREEMKSKGLSTGKVLLFAPFSTLRDPIDSPNGGLGCTKVIA
ncbi:hypothetical protein HY489_04195 [Candidatus Woesearchaeota archaeon]|nr:hypothetical protein [Candidatus Woesearchaeota archaeon]